MVWPFLAYAIFLEGSLYNVEIRTTAAAQVRDVFNIKKSLTNVTLWTDHPPSEK